jgi:hypothetical protein
VKNLTTNKYVIVVRPCNQDHFLEYLFHKDPKAKAVFTKNSMSKYETIKVETTLESEKISKDCRILSIEKFNQEGDSI